MRVLGSVIGAQRGRLGLLAGLAIAIIALPSVSASDAAVHFGLGVFHGVCGMGTGAMRLGGAVETALTHPRAAAQGVETLGQLAAQPGQSLERFDSAIIQAWHDDAPYFVGDMSSLLIPIGVAVIAGGPGAAAITAVGATLAAAASPQVK